MSADPPSEDPPEPPGAGPSRRRFVVGAAIAIAAVAAGAVTLTEALAAPTTPKPPSPGLVTRLLRTRAFSVAHRGGSLDWPEMSLFAYRQAVALGVDALEISLARSSDGVWFGLHDATLDRTSGTTNFVASEHSWAEISALRITAAHTTHPGQSTQPYLRFEDLVKEFGTTHSIFVDPKVVKEVHYPELFAMMSTPIRRPTETFIAKGGGTSTAWADAARARGYRSWGFYYGVDIDARPKQLSSTQSHWSMLGLDYGASDAAWATVKGYGKKVLGHVISNKAQERVVLGHGAAGLVIAGIEEVLG